MTEAFSHFKLSCFEACPKEYYFRYIARNQVDLVGIEAFTGKQVHEVLQQLYLLVADGEVPKLDWLMSHYRQIWRARLDIDRIRIVHTERAPSDYLSNGERCIENYYLRHYPFDADETLGLEKQIRFQLDDEGRYKIRAVIDRLARTPDGVLQIHDFKTGSRVPSQALLDTDRQLGLYEIGVREHLPETGRILLVWHYALLDQLHTSVRTLDQLAELRKATIAVIARIQREKEWSPSPGPLCAWCDYKEICPAFRDKLLRLL